MNEKEIKLSERELKALRVLWQYDDGEGWCITFKTVAKESDIPADKVRRTVRALARKGMAKYHRGLFDDDGMVAGSGYCCSPAGRDYMQKLEDEEAARQEEKDRQSTLI